MVYIVQRAKGFAGYYTDPSGRRRSAGIFPSKREAQNAAVRAETGVMPETDWKEVGSLTVEEYSTDWLNKSDPEVLPNTLRSYEQAFRVYIVPFMGGRQVSKITRRDVEALMSHVRATGVSEHIVANVKAALGSCLRSLVPDVLPYNPTHGIKIARPPGQDFDYVNPEEVKAIAAAMPNEGSSLLVTFLAATGARFGEASEVRVRDLNFRDGSVRLSRRVVDLIRKKSNGQRFRVISGTKAGQDRARTIRLPERIMTQLKDWIRREELGPDDLIFPARLVNPKHRTIRAFRQIRPGERFSVGNLNFRHGTSYGYSGGGCRCDDCREALRIYRANREADTRAAAEEHLSNNAWSGIWRAAVKKADLGWYPRSYDLRHAFATNLVSSGVSIHEVKELMGHRRIETTLIYLHRVESQMSMARDAIDAFAP